MGTKNKAYLYCFDDKRNFSEEIRKRFPDSARYVVRVFHSPEDFIGHLTEERENRYCKVAIVGVHESNDEMPLTDQLTTAVRNIDNTTGIILIIPKEKIDAVKKAIKFNIDSYVEENSNTLLRVHNAVKKLISEYNLMKLRRRRNLSVSVLIFLTLIVLLMLSALYLRFRNLI